MSSAFTPAPDSNRHRHTELASTSSSSASAPATGFFFNPDTPFESSAHVAHTASDPDSSKMSDIAKMRGLLEKFKEDRTVTPTRESVCFLVGMVFDKWVRKDFSTPEACMRAFGLAIVNPTEHANEIRHGAMEGDVVYTKRWSDQGKPITNRNAMKLSFAREARILHTVMHMGQFADMTDQKSGQFIDPELDKRYTRAYHTLVYCHHTISNWVRMVLVKDDDKYHMLPDTTSLIAMLSGTAAEYRFKDKNSMQMKLLEFCIGFMARNNLRPYLNYVYSQRRIQAAVPVMNSKNDPLCELCNRGLSRHRTKAGRRCDHAFKLKYKKILGKSISTRSWERYSTRESSSRIVETMENFVRAVADYACKDAYEWARSGKGVVTWVAEELMRMNDFRCRPLVDTIEPLSLSTRSGVIRYDLTKTPPKPVFHPYKILRESMGLSSSASTVCAEDLSEEFAAQQFVQDGWFHPHDLAVSLRGPKLTKKEAEERGLVPPYDYANYILNRICKKCKNPVQAHVLKGIKYKCKRTTFRDFKLPTHYSVCCVNCGNEKEACECGNYCPYALKIGSAMNVPTPIIDSIFTKQGLDEETLKWLWIMVGKIFW